MKPRTMPTIRMGLVSPPPLETLTLTEPSCVGVSVVDVDVRVGTSSGATRRTEVCIVVTGW